MRSVLILAALLVGCASSSSSPPPGPCKVEGTWAIHYNRSSSGGGTCVGGPDAFDEVVTITQRTDDPGAASMQFQGAGGGCIGTLDGCKLTNDCTETLAAGGQSTRQDSWTFNGNSVGGSSFFSYPLTNGSGNCSYNTVLSGTKK